MFPEGTKIEHAFRDTVTDDCVHKMYSNEILYHWENSKWILPETSRISPSPRCIDFYNAAYGGLIYGRGMEFQSGGFALRLYLDYHHERQQGFKSSFVKKTGEGILEVFNTKTGASKRMAGRWMMDEADEEVFLVDETLRSITDNPFVYNHGYHLSRFMNREWPDELLVRPRRKKAVIADGPFVPPQNS